MTFINYLRRAGMTLAAASLGAGATMAAGALIVGLGTAPAFAQQTGARAVTATMPPMNDGLPMPGFDVTKGDTAIVITDPQNDFLSPDGVTWGVVGQSITENGTVGNPRHCLAETAPANRPKTRTEIAGASWSGEYRKGADGGNDSHFDSAVLAVRIESRRHENP